jgi:dTDP-3-amino-2,3,6-trideoxy-4-keto-D-glucose/dTDP-3-amino-3,4,6-trideoxy-alpha-D-glucose/dTDP-2,6-dideoxy-D-kanosamine transaminase
MKMIKSWDYQNEYTYLKKDILKSIDKVLKSGNLFFGKELNKFEKIFLKTNNSRYGVAVASGTDAIYLSLKALDIGPNDEVITVANTAIPTVSAIRNTGANVKFVDTRSDYLMDPNKLEKAISKKTKVIIPVHLYGQSCEMNKIIKIANRYKIKIVEDCAQAQGATYNKKKVGNMGTTGCFSFYPTKILGAYGDGGFVTTRDKKIYQKLSRLRFYGMEQMNPKKWWNKKYFAVENGTNSRLSEIQSAILNIKIKYLKTFIKKRREIAQMYNKGIKNKDIIKPIENKNNFHVYHLYVVAHKNRKLILQKMKKNNIHLGIQYPYPIHKMNAYRNTNLKKLVNTENQIKNIFSLPTYPLIEKNKIKKIIEILNKI